MPPYDPILGLEVDRLLNKKPLWRLNELLNEIHHSDYTALIQMIDTNRLAFNISSSSLAFPEQCYVAENFRFISDISDTSDEFHNSNSLSNFTSPSFKDSKKILDRLDRIASGEKSSSVRRWKKQIEEGSKKGLQPFHALMDKDRNANGRKSKLKPEVKDFLDVFAQDVYLSMRTESMLQIYYEYCIQSEKAHPNFKPASKDTFYTRMHKISPELKGEAKGGRRMSLAMLPPSNPLKRYIAPSLPWMKVGVDHSKIKLSVIVFENLEHIYVNKPWLSIMFDIATSEVLAFTISFQAPSRSTCAKLMRECVRQHGKLPREILTDHGSDFTSVYFRSLLANYRITHSLRPAANPRSGSEVERFFKQYKQDCLSQRPGYQMDLRTLRSIDGKNNSDNFAVLRIEDLYQELTAYLKWRSSKPIGKSNEASELTYKRKLNEFPFIPIQVEYDKNFILATSVESNKYKIDFQRGIHIKDIHYSCPELSSLNGYKKDTEVRIDPENPFVIYILANNKWHSAYNSEYNQYIQKNLTERISKGIEVIELSNTRRKIRESKGIELRKQSHSFDNNLMETEEKRITRNLHQEKLNRNTDKKIVTEDFSFKELNTEEWDD